MKRKVVIKINQLCEREGISLRDLSILTKIQYESLYELANKKGKSINLRYVERIADVLNINDITEIIAVEDDLS